jgi:hypothetical protein
MENDYFGIPIAPMNDYSDRFAQRLLKATQDPGWILACIPGDTIDLVALDQAIVHTEQAQFQAVDHFGIPVRSRNSYSARTFARLEVLSGQVRLKALSRTPEE